MRRIRVNVHIVVTNVIVEERNKANISVINNVFVEQETKWWKMDVYIRNDSRWVWPIRGRSGECDPVGMMTGSHKRILFTVRRAGNFANFRPWGLLDKYNVELSLSLKEGIDNKRVLVNILWKNFDVFHNHCCTSSFTSEQIDLDLFLWISAYFFYCHSLLNLCLQNGHKLESAWWSPRQFKHLKE